MPITPKQQPPYYQPSTTSPTKQYTALVSQTGTAIPTTIILQNTLSGTPIWARIGPGVYTITLTNTFTTNKTIILWGPGGGDPEMTMNYFFTSDDVIEIDTYLAGTLSDEVLANATLQIIVYP